MKKELTTKLFCMLVFLMTTTLGFAADPEDGGGDTDDTTIPAAPINDYIPVALIAAAGLGYVALRKKTSAE